MSSSEYSAPLASVGHRLGGKALDVVLSIVTLNIGWIIWSLVVWGQGQTPGKQILKMRVYDKTTCKPAKWGHMAIREFGLFLATIVIGYVGITMAAMYPNTLRGALALFLVFFAIVFFVLDPLWIFKRGKRNRLTDVILKTDVINESPDPR